MPKFLIVLTIFVCTFAMATEDGASESDSFPISLVEINPQLSFLSQSWVLAGTPTPVYSNFNPGGVIRFTPIWRKKFPIYIHFGGTAVTEINNVGYRIVGEHENLKFIWTFGTRFGFRPLPRWILSVGMEFNHEPFLFDQGNATAFLNKVLVPTLVIMSSYEWWRTERLSMLIDAAIKAYFTVPMDWYMFRNGLVFHAKGGARWKIDKDFVASASLFAERRAFSTNVGDVAMFNFGLELGLGWGDGK